MRTTVTSFGKLGTIVYGADFHWDDVLYQLGAYLVAENFLAFLLLGVVLTFAAYTAGPKRSRAAAVCCRAHAGCRRRLARRPHSGPRRHAVRGAALRRWVKSAFERVAEGVARERRFTANSAHELRTPIAILGARIDKLEDSEIKSDFSATPRVRDHSRAVARAGAGSASMPRKDLPRTSIFGKRCDRSSSPIYMPLAVAARRHIDYEAPPAPVRVRAQTWAVESAITNLVDNAIRSEPPDGSVVVGVAEDGTVRVVDHGEGVDPKHRAAIFEPFWRKSDAAPGAGLGLAITKELMEKQGDASGSRKRRAAARHSLCLSEKLTSADRDSPAAIFSG